MYWISRLVDQEHLSSQIGQDERDIYAEAFIKTGTVESRKINRIMGSGNGGIKESGKLGNRRMIGNMRIEKWGI